ncbi:MAG: hypothetical protein K5886_01615 [Lachnospiraceae bacterium]|nr:hypothetical protein [Lachnospiraceae bacterium]
MKKDKKRIWKFWLAAFIMLPLIYSKIRAVRVNAGELIYHNDKNFYNYETPYGCDSLVYTVHRSREGDIEYTCPFCNGLYSYVSVVRGYISEGKGCLIIKDMTTGDETTYSSDAAISLDPGHKYIISMKNRQGEGYSKCVGEGTEGSRGCGFGISELSEISGEVYIYGPSAPEITSQPVSQSAVTDGSASFSVGAANASGYKWQIVKDGTCTDLNDGVLQNGISYSGCNSSNLVIGGIRYGINGTGYRCVVSGANNMTCTSADALLTVTDKTPPQLVLSPNRTEYGAENVIYTVTASDLDTGLADKPYSFDGGATWTSQNVYEQTENGRLTVFVRDRAGNTAGKAADTQNIDRKAPDLSAASKPANNPACALIVITASDSGSGLSDTPYWYNGAWHSEAGFTVSKNGTYEIKARDRAGNTASTTCRVSSIKSVTPTPAPTGVPGAEPETPYITPAPAPTVPVPGDIKPTPTPDKPEGPTITIRPEKKDEPDDPMDKRDPDTEDEYEKDPDDEESGYMITTDVYDMAEPAEEEEQPGQAVLGANKPPVVIGAAGDVSGNKRNKVPVTALLIAGLILLTALIIFVLFFLVIFRYEKEEDEEGRKKYGIAGISCLYYREGFFAVRVSSRTYDMAPLRVVFGIVFVTFFEGCELRAVIKDEERCRTFTKKLTVSKDTLLK